VNTPNKPDPARAWLFVQKLLDEEEIERIDKLSEEELDRELRAQGIEPSRLPSAEELLAKATAHTTRALARRTTLTWNGASGPPTFTPSGPLRYEDVQYEGPIQVQLADEACPVPVGANRRAARSGLQSGAPAEQVC
jgi:hypothetical protein